MYNNPQEVATKIYEILDDLIVTDDKGNETSIDNILDGQQKYSLIMSIVNGLPKTDFQSVIQFNQLFQVQKEETHVVRDCKGNILSFNLILEEALEFGKALGFDNATLYNNIIEVYSKVKEKEIEPGLVEVADALTDLLYVTYRGFYTYNLTDIQYQAMQEVHQSNISKLIPDNNDTLEVIKETIKTYGEQGIQVTSVNLKNGYFAIVNRATSKILKPVSYVKPDLKTIINNHLNK